MEHGVAGVWIVKMKGGLERSNRRSIGDLDREIGGVLLVVADLCEGLLWSKNDRSFDQQRQACFFGCCGGCDVLERYAQAGMFARLELPVLVAVGGVVEDLVGEAKRGKSRGLDGRFEGEGRDLFGVIGFDLDTKQVGLGGIMGGQGEGPCFCDGLFWGDAAQEEFAVLEGF